MSSHTEAHTGDSDRLLQAAQRRAQLAPILGWVFLALGLGLIIGFLIQAGFFSALLPKPAPVPLTVEKPEQISGSFARIAGFDNEKQPYEVTAKKGYQDKEVANLVHMEDLVGTFRRGSGQSYKMFSNTGRYDSKAREMDLEGKIRIVEAGRFTATMEKAHIAMETKNLVANVPVLVEMGSGTITANGMKISNDGKNILFLNGVKARFTEIAKKGDNTQ
jgi:lipopolysaccharide export system protein LptC